MYKVLAVVGTRPDAIKMCPLIKELKKRENIICRVLSSGQHRELLSGVLAGNGVSADIELSAMREGQSLSRLTERLFVSLRAVIEREAPSLLIVHGDTTTAFCAALVGFLAKVPVAHVEAGLRSGDIESPYPEEMNRRTIGQFAKLHFAPGEIAKNNLLREGVDPSFIFVTGNTVHDALAECYDENFTHPILDETGGAPYVILTAHRRENGDKLEQMLSGVRDALEELRLQAVFPVHPSRRTTEAARRVFDGCGRVHICAPLSAYEFQNLLARCFLAVTDSGGVQEEAPAFGKPVLVLRDLTEREEELKSGALLLGGTSRESVRASFKEMVGNIEKYRFAAEERSRTQTGAAKKIADIICDSLAIC